MKLHIPKMGPFDTSGNAMILFTLLSPLTLTSKIRYYMAHHDSFSIYNCFRELLTALTMTIDWYVYRPIRRCQVRIFGMIFGRSQV